MKLLVVTEKFSPHLTKRDGGARLVVSLKENLKESMHIMQFDGAIDSTITWYFNYPIHLPNRFEQRLANASFIANKLKEVEHQFTHIAFVHVSMQFGCVALPLTKTIETWTFPMFLTPSYKASGETVPAQYTLMESLTLANTQHILTPSYLEKRQLLEFYHIPEEKISVIPRGVDTSWMCPIIRLYNTKPVFCSVGSIKPQKNTLRLINLFAKIQHKLPDATLNIIGPVQNRSYYKMVKKQIQRLALNNQITITGYIPSTQLAATLADAHIHISTSKCETFGRSVFETLASGIPNITTLVHHAAAEFLPDLPYIKFIDDDHKAVDIVEYMLNNLSKLSEMSLEIGELYNQQLLDRLLVATIQNKEALAISDFDGTLFYKHDPIKTHNAIQSFNQYKTKILCSARPLNSLIQQMQLYHLKVDWIIAYSGAVIADGMGHIVFIMPIDPADIQKLMQRVREAEVIKIAGKVVQITMPLTALPPNNVEGHVEIYQKTAFISHWKASKLYAIHRLLNYIHWEGRVAAFGDSSYDKPFLTFFDGKSF